MSINHDLMTELCSEAVNCPDNCNGERGSYCAEMKAIIKFLYNIDLTKEVKTDE